MREAALDTAGEFMARLAESEAETAALRVALDAGAGDALSEKVDAWLKASDK